MQNLRLLASTKLGTRSTPLDSGFN